MMANNVAVTYGKERFPNMDLCAKSGTAEVGTGQAPHAWFAGFLRGSDTPYAFVVLVENGGGGAAVAGHGGVQGPGPHCQRLLQVTKIG
jgi:cell division protein FtsI/penicillin-binding protein 2